MSVNIRRLLIDALKPREASIVELSRALCSSEGVEEVDIVVMEVDVKTETVKLTIRGSDVRFEDVSRVLEENSISIKGVDEVSVVKTKPPMKTPAK